MRSASIAQSTLCALPHTADICDLIAAAAHEPEQCSDTPFHRAAAKPAPPHGHCEPRGLGDGGRLVHASARARVDHGPAGGHHHIGEAGRASESHSVVGRRQHPTRAVGAAGVPARAVVQEHGAGVRVEGGGAEVQAVFHRGRFRHQEAGGLPRAAAVYAPSHGDGLGARVAAAQTAGLCGERVG